jgi:hypothetical protein
VSRLLQLLNADRAAAGLARLESDPAIERIASGWSSAMAEAGALSHNDRYFDRETRVRLNATRLGENVAVARDAEQAHRALMDSAPHRANVLDAGFTHVGVGAALRDGRWWFTEDFAQVKRTEGVAAAPASERARGGVGATRVVAASPVNGIEPIESLDTVPRPSGVRPTAVGATVLAGEDLPNPRAAAIAAAILTPVGVIALALRRRARADLAEVRTDVRAAPNDLVTRLTLARSWARTLEERWASMSEGDRRAALQSLRRNVEDAISLASG